MKVFVKWIDTVFVAPAKSKKYLMSSKQACAHLDICIDMCVDMCIDICLVRSIGMCLDV